MLIDLDQNTLANMTAALEFVCKRLPVDKDTPARRKQIADELIARADHIARSKPVDGYVVIRISEAFTGLARLGRLA
jgi:hypothetical protein